MPEDYDRSSNSPFAEILLRLHIQAVLQWYEYGRTTTKAAYPDVNNLFVGDGLTKKQTKDLLQNLETVRTKGQKDKRAKKFLGTHDLDDFTQDFLAFLEPINRDLPESRLRTQANLLAGDGAAAASAGPTGDAMDLSGDEEGLQQEDAAAEEGARKKLLKKGKAKATAKAMVFPRWEA